jgi:hypothetical protein
MDRPTRYRFDQQLVRDTRDRCEVWSELPGNDWLRHSDALLGAGLAYYSVFSLGPLLLIVVSVAGLFFWRSAMEKAPSAMNGYSENKHFRPCNLSRDLSFPTPRLRPPSEGYS